MLWQPHAERLATSIGGCHDSDRQISPAASTPMATFGATAGAHLGRMASRVPPRRDRRDRQPNVRPLPSRAPDLTPKAARLLLTRLVAASERAADELPNPPDDAA